ncbi:LysR family transcriptional regulator [Paenarthrobacter nitroguajacolicus]
MNFEHLKALSAIVETGSFDAAATLLGITPSAVSQRIKALETSAGQILVRRSLPSSPTEAGAVLLRTARQIQALEADALQSLGQGPEGRATVALAVNADSLATWFIPVLHDAATWSDAVLDLHIEDQDHSSRLLRQGDVLGGSHHRSKSRRGMPGRVARRNALCPGRLARTAATARSF